MKTPVRRTLFAAAAGCLSLSLLAAAPLASDTPLVTDGPIVVDVADFEGALQRIPEQYRNEVRMSREHIATLVDQVFLARTLAARARKEGLDRDPVVKKRLEQAEDNVLADLYLEKVKNEAAPANLDMRAQELYKADPDKYKAPEEVNVQEVLVSLKGRTPDMARALAQKVYDQAQAGKMEFLELAMRYSDEPAGRGMRGDLGWTPLAKLPAAARDALAGMKKGDVSKPVETEAGFVVLKLVDRKPAHALPFEAVKASIIEDEKTRLAKERIEAMIRHIRSSKTAEVRTANVDALVIKVPDAAVKHATEAESKK